MKRREFIILSSVGAASAGVFSACGHAEEKLIPALIPDDEYIPGIDVWKASTCAMCDAGCGILVRTRDHKANKIEGNPAHPVNRGALCARGQAGLQVLYNPDRIKAPMKRTGERGSGQFEEISWDEAIKTLADKLREIKAQGKTNSVFFATSQTRGVNGIAAFRFLTEYGSAFFISSPSINEVATHAAYSRSFHQLGTPTFDIANATYLLSFGARFLETWLSPVMYSLAYGAFRRSNGRPRGKFVQIEPRMSLTAANADEWLPAAPNSEELLALAMCQVIVRERLNKEAVSTEFANALEEYAPEKTADLTDIPAEKVIRIAREFAASERALAIASATPMTERAVAVVNLLNAFAGNWNKPGGMFLPPIEPDFPQFFPLAQFAMEDRPLGMGTLDLGNALREGKVDLLMVHHFNFAYIAPQSVDKIKAVPFIASFSSFIDETTTFADLLLPDNTSLESWDLRGTNSMEGKAVASLSGPVVKPEFNTRQTADVLVALSKAIGQTLPFESAENAVQQATKEIAKTRASIKEENFEEFWEPFNEHGVWVEEAKPKQEADAKPGIEKLKAEVLSLLANTKSQFVKDYSEVKNDGYNLSLIVYEHPTLGYGEQANLPLLQELPDALTSVMWGSWVEINPKTAASLGIADGDVVEVTSQNSAVRAPAVLYPAIRPDVIAMPLGQGHTAFGRYAKNVGANPFELPIALWVSNPQEGAKIIRAKVTRISSEGKLIRFGTTLPEHIETKR